MIIMNIKRICKQQTNFPVYITKEKYVEELRLHVKHVRNSGLKGLSAVDFLRFATWDTSGSSDSYPKYTLTSASCYQSLFRSLCVLIER